jgi:hypothetical protein
MTGVSVDIDEEYPSNSWFYYAGLAAGALFDEDPTVYEDLVRKCHLRVRKNPSEDVTEATTGGSLECSGKARTTYLALWTTKPRK